MDLLVIYCSNDKDMNYCNDEIIFIKLIILD
jgi:hypothetical protein